MDAAAAPGDFDRRLIIECGWRDPVERFLCFARDPDVVFLDSGGTTGPRSRYSYLCIDPFAVIRDQGLDALERQLVRYRGVWPEAPVPFWGGAAGFVGYEAASALERVPRPAGCFSGVPDMAFALYDLVFAWDHVARRCWLLCASGDAARAERVLARSPVAANGIPQLAWRQPVPRRVHMARVAQVLEYIRAGDIYQANLAAPFEAPRPARVHASDVYLALRASNPAPFGAYIACGEDNAIASVSPERFMRLGSDGAIETRPIKGTRPRGGTAAEDQALAAELLASAKDRAENLMIVDLLRNDMSRVSVPGSVRVNALAALESFASVHHLVSSIGARLAPGRGAVDLLRASLPGGSITGAPKIRAMRIIAELEQVARGPYCGSAAWIGFDGAMDSSILIRTVTVAADRIVAQAGGGIVADSDPAAEWDELMTKLRPLLTALGPLPGEEACTRPFG